MMLRFLILMGIAAPMFGQVSSASLLGEVKDETGALATGAAVTALNNATGFSRTVSTGEVGSYRIDDLAPGEYTVTAGKAGFRTTSASHVAVEVNQRAKLDFILKVGAETDTVLVSANVSTLQMDDESVGYRLDSHIVTELPLAARNIASLITLGPGAIPRQLGGFVHDANNDVQQGPRGAVGVNPPINGSRPNMNVFLLDGALNTDQNTFAMAVNPPMESVQEFRIQTSLASAEFAQAAGGVIDVVTKAGSQQFHGSLFEFFRNEKLDAHNFFDDPTLQRPIFRRNQFGGSLGGPVPIAKKTFFFATYEGLIGKTAKPSPQTLPSAALRGGDFSAANPIYDPLNIDSTTGMRTPFAGNLIPANRIDPIAAKYLQLYEPLPNISGGSSNYIDTTPSKNNNNNVSGRVDHQISEGAWMFGRYTINDEQGGIGGNFPLRPTTENVRAQQAVLGYTYGRASWLNEARLSYLRLRVFDVPQSAFKTNIAQALGIANAPTDPFNFGLPYFLVTNYATVTDDPTLPQVQRDNTWQFSDALSLQRGRRTWKFGFEVVHFGLNYLQSNSVRGQYTYSGGFTSNGLDFVNTGDGLADFLLGFPQQTQHTVGSSQAYLRDHSYSLYAQQDWRVNNRLTLNAGVRWEYHAPFTDAGNKLFNLDYSNLPADPKLVRVQTALKPERDDFAPRVGLAWRLPGDTVFRAGYGIFFNQEIAVEAYDLVLNQTHNEMNSSDGTQMPVLTTRDGFPSTATTGFPVYFGLDPKARTPYMQQWNASFQRMLPGQVMAELSYIGSKGTHLGLFRRFNTALHTETGENLDPRPGDLQSLRTFPDLGPIVQRQHIATSSYGSLQLKVEKRLRKRLSFLSSFVWSKSIDDATSEVPGLYDSSGAQDERNLRLNRGLSFFDVRRRLSGGFVYGLGNSRILSPVLSNWQLSGIVTLQDGTPLDPIFFAYDGANTGTLNRPDYVAGQKISLPASQRTGDRWFNTNAFAYPAPFHFGTAGRDTIPGPGNQVVDLSLDRRFLIGEGRSIQFRAEGFNILNNPNLGIPLSDFDFGPLAGKIFGSGDPRRIQFALRFDF